LQVTGYCPRGTGYIVNSSLMKKVL